MDRPKIAIALGGGGARGFAHIGVLQILQEQGYLPDRIAGTSMGAVVGAMFSETLDAHEVEHRFARFMESDTYRKTGIPRIIRPSQHEANFWDQIVSGIRGRLVVNIAESRKAIVKRERLRNALSALFSIRDFNQCRIPLTVLATDLLSGQNVPLKRGDLLTAVEASASIPGFLPPVDFQGYLLGDGGIGCPIPVDYVQQSGEAVLIAIGVPPPLHDGKRLTNAVDILNRSEQITSHYYSMEQIASAEVQVLPDVSDVKWNEFDRMEEMIAAGRKSGEEMLPVLEEAIFNRYPLWRRLLISLGILSPDFSRNVSNKTAPDHI